MKPLNKRINKKKASKVTLKNGRKHHRLADHDEKAITNSISSVRPEEIKMHQHY